MNATIRHCDYSNPHSFARVTQEAFGDRERVSVLPNAAVMGACLRAGGRRLRDVVVSMIFDRAGIATAYQIGGEFGEVICIDAFTNESRSFNPGSGDEEEASQWDDHKVALGV